MPRNNPTRDDRLVLAIAGGMTIKDAASAAGMGERTAHRRVRDPEFAARVTSARDEIWHRAVGGLADAATEAVEALRQLLANGSAMARLGAARAILDAGPRLREIVEHETRLAALEAKLNASK